MATFTYIKETNQSIAAMKGLISYCTQDKKVYDRLSEKRLVGGVNCDGENAFTEFMVTKKSYLLRIRKDEDYYEKQYKYSIQTCWRLQYS